MVVFSARKPRTLGSARSIRAVKGSLGHSLTDRGLGDQEALARASGTARRASGWAGEKVSRSRKPDALWRR